MTIYVSHCYGGKIENFERAKKITHDLQVGTTTKPKTSQEQKWYLTSTTRLLIKETLSA